MKVVFLDVDGVLNTEETFERNYQEYLKTGIKHEPIDEFRIGYLKEIIDKTGAKIVLSSSWRLHCEFEDEIIVSEEGHTKYLLAMLAKYGMTLYDITGYDRDSNRGNEINEWLSQNVVESFIILDDSSDDLQDYIDRELIKTSFYCGENSGLCQEHIEVAIDKLNSVKNKVLIRSRNEENISRGC